jgi:hypothetical protein
VPQYIGYAKAKTDKNKPVKGVKTKGPKTPTAKKTTKRGMK